MKYLYTLAVVLLPFCLFSNSIQAVSFLEGGLPQARQLAAEEGKLYFVHCTADWIMTCHWMETHTFADLQLAAYLEKAYLAVRADIDQPEGLAIVERYGVTLLPSILIFSSRGQLLARHTGAVEPEALLPIFKEYDQPAHRSASGAPTYETAVLSSPQPILRISRPALLPDALPVQAVAQVVMAPAAPQLSREDAYGSREQEHLFTIQAGVFSRYENAVRELSRLERQLGLSLQLAPDGAGDTAVYRLFIGRFKEQAAAQQFLQSIAAQGVSGFIRKMGN